MLTIHNELPGSMYSTTPMGTQSSAGNAYSYYFCPWFGPYSPTGTANIAGQVNEIPGLIWDGKDTNPAGDTSCLHRNFEGDIRIPWFISSWNPVVPGSKTLWPTFVGKSGTKSYTFSHLAGEGTNEVCTYSYDRVSTPPLAGEGNGTFWTRVYNMKGIWAQGVFNLGFHWNTTQRKFVENSSGSIIAIRVNSTVSLKSAAITTNFTKVQDFLSFDPSSLPLAAPNSGLVKRVIDSSSDMSSTSKMLMNCTQDYLVDIMPTKFCPVNEDDIGDLAQRCVDQQDFVDVNTLGFLNELRDVGMLIPKISGLKNPKTYASLFLWFKYGLSLTVSDAEKLERAVREVHEIAKADRPSKKYASQVNIKSARKYSFTETLHYKLVYAQWPSDLMNFIGKARKWNLWPKLATGWDMIPFSFVVDWAIDIQSLLHRLDTQTDVQYFDTIGTCWSRKIECDISASELFNIPVSGRIHFTHYYRRAERFVRLPRLRVDQPQQFKNYLELAALIVTKKR